MATEVTMNSTSPKPRVVDQEVRDAVIAREQSFIVQAPAGSGKTELLIQRFLNLLSDPALDEPEAVVAITFTRKAAAEMRNRVREALELAASGESVAEPHRAKTLELATAVLARDRERGWNLLHNVARLNIRTLDSLCEQIVQSGPLRAGFGSRLNVTEDASGLYRDAARRTVLMLGGADPALNSAMDLLLEAADAQATTLEELIASMLAKREQWLPIVARARNTSSSGLRAELEESLAAAIGIGLGRIREELAQALGSRVGEFLSFARTAAIESPSDFGALAGLTDLPPGDAGAQQAWRTLRNFLFTKSNTVRKKVEGISGKSKKNCADFLDDLGKSEQADSLCDIGERIFMLPDPCYKSDEWQRIEALFTVLPVAERALAEVFGERGQTDFVEIARAAVEVLRAHADNPAYAARHILVDEFQDTSVLQVELLRALMSGWRDADGRTVFLVGDPMQSIYSFRKAEVTLFERARDKAAKLLPREIEAREITVNFRSQKGLVEWFNQTFGEMMTGANAVTGAVGYARAEAIHDAVPPAVEVRSFADGDVASEADYIAEAIRKEHEASPSAKIAILVRARQHLAQIVPALERKKIRFKAVNIDPLAERTVIRDLLALARALTHLGDRTSWLALLRAPWCGLTLEDLTRLAGDKESHNLAIWELLAARRTSLSQDAQARLQRVLPVLQAALAQRGRVSLRSLVEHTWNALGGPAAVRESELGESDLRDAGEFFRFLDQSESAGELPEEKTLDQALAWLFSPTDTDANTRVELMTMHGAKGLQFDVVFVPGLGRKPHTGDRQLLYWREFVDADEQRLLLAPFDPLRDPPEKEATIAGYIRDAQKEAWREEAKRLIYVACTRARQRLYLTFHRPADKKNGEAGKSDGDSLLRLLAGVKSFDELVKAGPEVKIAPDDPKPTLRRLTQEWSAPKLEREWRWRAVVRPERDHTFEWVGQKQRIVGTVTHRFLQQIGREGLERWTAERVGKSANAIRAALASEGINEGERAAAAKEVSDGLCAILAHDKGQWILSSRAEAECEFPLSGADGDVDFRLKLDRTFVDEDGTRWIVDYKMATTTSTAVEKFVDQQVEKYREDMERYGRVMRSYDSRPVRMGLYFPLLREWREIPSAEEAVPARKPVQQNLF